MTGLNLSEAGEVIEHVAGNKWVLWGGGAALAVVAFLFIRAQSSAAPSDSSNGLTDLGAYSPFSPVSAGGGASSTDAGGAPSTDALVSLETLVSNNNFNLASKQLDIGLAEAQLSAATQQAGLQVAAQGQQYSFLGGIVNAFAQQLTNGKRAPLNVVNGQFNLGNGQTLGFNLSNYWGDAPQSVLYSGGRDALSPTLFPTISPAPGVVSPGSSSGASGGGGSSVVGTQQSGSSGGSASGSAGGGVAALA